MERRGQDRDIGIPNSKAYNPPQITQESPVKLPLAPIVSTPQDRRGNATLSTRRGSSIFSPTQTLDHQPYHHHHQLLNPPQVLQDSIPDPDPPTPTTDGAANSKTPTSPPQPQAPPPQPPVPRPRPPPPPPPASSTMNTAIIIRYRECLKNHAASMGGHVVDGCGEFMPSGEEGTAEALRCAACDCHRNFHRKEVEGEAQLSNYCPLNPSSGNNNSNRTPLIHSQLTPPSMAAHHHHHHHHKHTHSGPTPPAMVNFGGNSGESSSEDLNNMFHSSGGGHAVTEPSLLGSKKRFRTKFSHEQKERMHEFAEKLGWRIQKQDEQQVQQFCNESGVKRQVFKVWMHNNKQAMKKRQI